MTIDARSQGIIDRANADIRAAKAIPDKPIDHVTIDGFPIDVVLTEGHTFNSEVTDYPVEDGADITDNIRAQPITITLDGIVSNTPIGDLRTIRQQETSPSGVHEAPAADAYARLLAIRDARKPVPISTSLKLFKNMALQSLSVPRDAKTGNAMRFTATFKQIRFVTNARTVVRTSSPRGQPKTKLGAKQVAAIVAGVTGALNKLFSDKGSIDTSQLPVDTTDNTNGTDTVTSWLTHGPTQFAHEDGTLSELQQVKDAIAADREAAFDDDQARQMLSEQRAYDFILGHGAHQ